MQRTAQIFSWLGIVAALVLSALAAYSAYRAGPMSFEALILLVPFGAALASFSYTSQVWLFRVALFTNGALCVLGVVVLLGEFFWGTLGVVFCAAFFLFVMIPSFLNCFAVSRVRAQNAVSG